MATQTLFPKNFVGRSSGYIASELLFVLCLFVTVGGFILFAKWSDNAVEELLASPATRGASEAYFDRGAEPLLGAMGLGVKISTTRSPGYYLKALDYWTLAAEPKSGKGEAEWVRDIKAREAAQANEFLAKSDVSAKDLPALREKLVKISPILDARDEAIVASLTSMEAMHELGNIQTKSVTAIVDKLKVLGASNTGLKSNGIYAEGSDD